MLNRNSEIFVTFKEGGKSLATAGVYTSADVKVTNRFTRNEKVEVITHSRMVSQPRYHKATRKLNLGWAFIEASLTKPKVPRNMKFGKFLSTPAGKLYKAWSSMNNEAKIVHSLKELAHDLNCTLQDYEIFE